MRFKLSLYWFFLFAGLGIFFPYFALYLRENAALSGSEIGVIMAALPAVGILAQPFWGQVADRSGRRLRVLTLLTVLSAAGYTALAWGNDFRSLLLITCVLAAFATAMVPMVVSVNMAVLGPAGAHKFGFIRVWGTVSFLIAVTGFPWLLHRVQEIYGWQRVSGGPSEPGLALMFPVTGALVALSALVALTFDEGPAVRLRARRGDWRTLLREPGLVRLLVFTFGAYLFLNGLIALFPVYVRSIGGDINMVGRMWIMMLVLEIPLVAFTGQGLRRFGPRGLLAAGTIAGGLRWVICAISDELWILYLTQLLHGVVVAGLMIGSSLYVDMVVPPQLRSTAQGLLATVGPGVAAILSNMSAGWLMDHQGVNATYLIGGVGALVLGLVVPWVLMAPKGRERG